MMQLGVDDPEEDAPVGMKASGKHIEVARFLARKSPAACATAIGETFLRNRFKINGHWQIQVCAFTGFGV